VNADSDSQDREELVIELYKSLRAEVSGYLEKVPALWLQKFILIGAMLAFLLTRKNTLNFIGKGNGEELGFDAALVAIVLLACFLDAKILEYSLHARAISAFIQDEFSDVGVLGRWEKTLWGYGSDRFARRLICIRSITTVIVTVLPTVLVIVLVSIVISIRRDAASVLAGGLLLSLAYIVVTIVMWRRVWPSEAQFRKIEQVNKIDG
jgi:hypothetical protein